MQNQGLRELLLPHRLSLWGRTAEQINDLEHKDRPIESFPFPLPNPLDNMDINHVQIGVAPDGPPPQLQFHKLRRLQTTTLPDSRTRITKAVQQYPETSRLHKVKTSDQLWDALVRFAVGDDDGSDDDQDEHQAAQFHTYRNGAPPVPPLEVQMKPVFNLWGWFLMHLATPTPMVNSEESVQDEIHRQLLHPIDQLIKTRYGTITTTAIMSDGRRIERRFAPEWNRHVKEHRVNAVSEAGIPDFLLLFKDGLKSVAMVAEAKNYWAYRALHIRTALSTKNITVDGTFAWAKNGVTNNIIRQLWSEMHEFGVKFGVWTNGQQIVVAIDTTNETVPLEQRQNELTFSGIQDICGTNDIYQGFAGFCFASIEYSVLATEDQKREFISNLCPEAWRTAPVPLVDMPVFDEGDGRVELGAEEEEP